MCFTNIKIPFQSVTSNFLNLIPIGLFFSNIGYQEIMHATYKAVFHTFLDQIVSPWHLYKGVKGTPWFTFLSSLIFVYIIEISILSSPVKTTTQWLDHFPTTVKICDISLYKQTGK